MALDQEAIQRLGQPTGHEEEATPSSMPTSLASSPAPEQEEDEEEQGQVMEIDEMMETTEVIPPSATETGSAMDVDV